MNTIQTIGRIEVVPQARISQARPLRKATDDAHKQVDRQVEDLFFRIHDRANPLHAKAFDEHMRSHRRLRRAKRPAKCVLKITNAIVLKYIVKHRVLDACENLAALEREAARLRLEDSRRRVVTQLGLCMGHFLGEDESIDVNRLQVVKINKVEEIGALKSLLGFCKGLGDGQNQTTVENLCNGVFPPEFERRPDFKAFLSDLGLLFVNEGDAVRKLVVRVCEEEPFARKVADNEELPKPLRYLASVAIRIHGLSAQKLEEDRVVGFGTGTK